MTLNHLAVAMPADLDSAVALLKEQKIENAIILEAATGQLHGWSGERHEAIELMEITPATDEYELAEAPARFLSQE